MFYLILHMLKSWECNITWRMKYPLVTNLSHLLNACLFKWVVLSKAPLKIKVSVSPFCPEKIRSVGISSFSLSLGVLLPKSFIWNAVSSKLSSDIIAALVNQFIISARKVGDKNGIRIIYHALCSAVDSKEFIKSLILL